MKPQEVAVRWFGESVGHYEGDTLVVNTIGITPRTFVDNYQTPHTDQLHVVERFQMADAGKTLEVKVHVEDPGPSRHHGMRASATGAWTRRRSAKSPARRITTITSITAWNRCRRRTLRISDIGGVCAANAMP